jgi:uncharacterized peroxidase-related enzyme
LFLGQTVIGAWPRPAPGLWSSRWRPAQWTAGARRADSSAAEDLATQRSGNDEAGRRLSSVGAGGRGLGPQAAGFRDPLRAGQLPASTGPAYEAIQNVGEAEFHRAAVEQAQGQLRNGLPLRADINVVGYLARKPEGAQRMTGSFLEEPAATPSVQALYDEDLADGGYVWNVSRLWAHQPDTVKRLFELMSQAFTPSGLSFRQRGILVTAAASTLGDSYCSLAWGEKLAKASDAAVAAGVLNGSDAGLTDQEKAMAAWARKVARDPNATTPADIEALRDSGLDDGQIFAITAFVALRLAFSTINDSLGAQPDAQLALSLPQEVREAVSYGRPVAT